MTTIATATSGAPSVVVKESGAKGLQGDAGVDGVGFNSVRKAMLDNPLLRLFQKNNYQSSASSDIVSSRDTLASFTNLSGVTEYSGGNFGTNRLIWSEEFDNVAWVKSGGASITPNQAEAPDGTITGDLLVSSSGGESVTQTITNSSAGFFSASIWVRSRVNATVEVTIRNSSSTDEKTTSVIASNSWQRFTATINDTVGENISIQITTPSAGNVFLWGAQLENSRVSNAYIMTGSSNVITPESGSLGVNLQRQQKNGFLNEGQITNLLTYSEDFSQWDVTGSASVSTNTEESPDLFTTADTITNPDGTGANRINQIFSSGFVDDGRRYTYSCFVKEGTQDEIQMRIIATGGGVDNGATFLFSTEQLTTTAGNMENPQVEKLSNGWFRISIVFITPNASSTNLNVSTMPRGSGGTVFLFGAQIEESNSVNSYVPSEASQSTKATDNVTINYENNFPSPSASWSVSFKKGSVRPSESGDFTRIFETNENAVTDRFRIFFVDSGNALRAQTGMLSVDANGGRDATHVCVTYDSESNIIRVYLDGSLVNSNVSGNASTTIASTVYIGRELNFNSPLNSSLEDFRVYDFTLNDNEASYLSGV